MTHTNATVLHKVANWAVLATLVLVIVLLLPITENFLFQTKLYVLFFATLVMAALYCVDTFRKKTIEIVFSSFTIPLLLFTGAILAATFFTNDYPVESLLSFGGAYLACSLLIFFSSSVVNKDLTRLVLVVLGGVSALLTVFAAAQLVGFGPANITNELFKINIPTTIVFSLAGSSFFALQLLVVTAIGMVVDSVSHKNIAKSTAVLFPIILVGIAIHLWAVLPGKPAEVVLPSWTASWSVALDTIRSPRAALIGAGPAAYTDVYLRFKPLWMNNTPLWTTPFSQASNFPLTLLTTTGFLGLITWLLLGYQAIKSYRKVTGVNKAISAMLIATFAIELFLPINIIILALQAVLFIALIAGQQDHLKVLKFQALSMHMQEPESLAKYMASKKVSFPIYLFIVIILVPTLIAAYLVVQSYRASMAFFDSSVAATNNDAVGVYSNQQKAVVLNPYYSMYRRQYAVTNMIIAASLANKSDATEAEKGQIGQLLQQAVREARSATLIDPMSTDNWTVLAQIYQNMIGAADQADQFAVQAYVNAVDNDPTNPLLRIQMGGIFLNQKNFAQAASLFKQAVDIKPDYPNGYYNLGYSLQQLGDLQNAQASYQALLKLLDPNSEDYKKISDEVAKMQKELDAQQAAAKAQNKAKAASSATTTSNTAGTQKSVLDDAVKKEPNSEVISNPSDANLQGNPGQTNLSQQVQPTPAPNQ